MNSQLLNMNYLAPTEPAEPAEPPEPTDSTDSSDSTDSTDSSDSSDSMFPPIPCSLTKLHLRCRKASQARSF